MWQGKRPRAPSRCSLPQPGPEAYLLCPAFIRSLILVVNPAGEVGSDHRDRQGNDGTPLSEQMEPKIFPYCRLGHHVSISER